MWTDGNGEAQLSSSDGRAICQGLVHRDGGGSAGVGSGGVVSQRERDPRILGMFDEGAMCHVCPAANAMRATTANLVMEYYVRLLAGAE